MRNIILTIALAIVLAGQASAGQDTRLWSDAGMFYLGETLDYSVPTLTLSFKLTALMAPVMKPSTCTRQVKVQPGIAAMLRAWWHGVDLRDKTQTQTYTCMKSVGNTWNHPVVLTRRSISTPRKVKHGEVSATAIGYIVRSTRKCNGAGCLPGVEEILHTIDIAPTGLDELVIRPEWVTSIDGVRTDVFLRVVYRTVDSGVAGRAAEEKRIADEKKRRRLAEDDKEWASNPWCRDTTRVEGYEHYNGKYYLVCRKDGEVKPSDRGESDE